MRHWYLVPLAAIAGLIAGSWGSRADVEALKELKVGKTVRAEASARSGFRAIASLANIPERTKVVRRERPAVTNAAETATAANAQQQAAHPRNHGNWMRRGDLRARIEEAQELWRTRCELAREQWKAKLGVEGERAEHFDASVEKMNAELRELMDEFAGEVAEARDVSPELGVKMMSAVTRTLSEGYDAVGECVGDEVRNEVSNIPLHEFIDPSVFEPMIRVQDYLEPDMREAETR